MTDELVTRPRGQESLEEVVLAYLQAADAGQLPNRQELLNCYPHLARELAQFFDDEEQLAPMLSPLRCRPQEDSASAMPSDTPEARADDAAGEDEPLPIIPGYEILAFEGKGGMGNVHKARQRSLNRIVALKTIRPHLLQEPAVRARFHAEAQKLAQLAHANIVQVWDHGEHEGKPYLSLEYVNGGSLKDRLKDGPWPAREAAALVAVLADAVEHAHQKDIIHRDLKPANILLTPSGVPKVADFGLARYMQADAGLTQPGERPCTPAYAPPEQNVGRWTDVFGLGVILYELLTGQPPYQGETVKQVFEQAQQGQIQPPRRLAPSVPRALERICLKALATDPRRRYPTAAALAMDLHHYLGRRRRRMMKAAAVIVLLLSALGAWIKAGQPGWPWPGSDPDPQPAPKEPNLVAAVPEPTPVELAARAGEILKLNCYRCHGQDGTVEGGFNYVLDPQQLAARGKKIVPGNPEASRLLQRVKKGEMPPEDEQPRPSAEDIAYLEKWVRAGAPDFNPPPSQRPFLTTDDVLQFIRKDLEQTKRENDRRFFRYFSIAHLSNAGLPEDGLQTYRLALFKLVNSLSWQKEIVKPLPIDPRQTIFRIDLREYLWDETVWGLIAAAHPYGVTSTTETARHCYEMTGSKLPVARADWFVFAASRPPLYHEILRLPATAEELEKLLRVNVKRDLEQRKRVARAGFNSSGIAVSNNRLIERHKFNDGAYWKSFDFARPNQEGDDRRNLFKHPLGPGEGPSDFRHDGGEIIFNLPNGLQAYLLVDGGGSRVDRGPANLVKDLKQKEGAVINGISCMSCHTRGVIDKDDQIRDHVSKNRHAFEDAVVEEVLDLYPPRDEFKKLLHEDAARFVRAVQAATGAPPGVTDPIVALASRYEWELDVELAAAEAGLRRDDFLKRLDRSKELTAAIGILQNSGGTVQRPVWEEHFGEVVHEMRLGEYQPMPERPAPAPPPLVKQEPDTITNSIGMKLKRIRPGKFLMGTSGEEGKPEHPHQVEITRPFAIGIYPVTQAQFQKIMGRNPSHFAGLNSAQHPVERVSWKDTEEFCWKLSELAGEKQHRRVYRLPTEAEWEYACRAGSREAYFFGADDRLLDHHAWHSGNAGGHTHPVGTRKPNAWGLFDMHGNVWQWCQDYYDADYYPQSPAQNPSGPATSLASMRVLRGGSFESRADACRCAARHSSIENFANSPAYGFRVVLELDD